jgi:hypothetical protein
VLLIQIFSSVTKAVQPSIFWSDSTIVLHGINTPPHSLKPFIANRVTEILQSSNVTQWRHVPSSDNADILSRRGNMEDLVHHNMLYRGSHWLTQAETTWPADELWPIEVPEKRKVTTLETTIATQSQILDRFSSLPLLKRVIAYRPRFFNNTRQQSKRRGDLTVEKLQHASKRIIGMLQKMAFSNEIQDLVANATASKTNQLIALNPFMDAEGIIRVGGRLAQSELKAETPGRITTISSCHRFNYSRSAHKPGSQRRSRHTTRSETNILASQRKSSCKVSNSKMCSVP